MYEAGELIITPEYQRLFRWTEDKQANFIESLLLGFPVPAIFVAEGDNGVWELVDGLQRLSTVFGYMGVRKDLQGNIASPSRLSFSVKDDRKLPLLEGFTYEKMSLRSRLTLKRTYCRVEVIKVGSAPNMKYDVFERLNTGGARLEPQEIRNAIFRASNPAFMAYCDELAIFPAFQDNLIISDNQRQSMFDRGLVLRFFTLKNNSESFGHDVEPFITSYVKKIIAQQVSFDLAVEKEIFEKTFTLIAVALGEDAWRHHRDGQAKGAFSVYVFDAISIGVASNLPAASALSSPELATRCRAVKDAAEFRDNAGAGGNTQARMKARLDTAIRIIRNGV
ncbi:DUF262 domain-containing protein [Methylobacterium sp. E-045]|uniref:DUF262 domain-containing protein n=1 Tax=Methylobacterium sp. E-045 TaxID=2836575 RepID=UPI001FBABD36|nr:DUF262 domain-containing protein [Methylobacterium sp. E-045]MCJ2129410.1 DUF262 domain-containing protein [Methylobacterium sp. E-045]